MNRQLTSAATSLILLSGVLLTSGCVGYVRETADYADVQAALQTKNDVTSLFGRPVREEKEGDLDVWYYLLKSKGIAGNPVVDSTNGVMLLVIPIWHTKEYKENAKFFFAGDTLVKTQERKEGGSGFICGIQAAHGIGFVCDSGNIYEEMRRP